MIKQSLTSLSSLEPLYDLARYCEVADGYPVKLYWNLVESRHRDAKALDYLYFISSDRLAKPMGLLSAYYFQDGIEITAMVDPDFRRQGVFSRLLKKALDALRLYQVTSYMLICHAKADIFNAKCVAWGGQLHHSEIEMQGPLHLTYSPKQSLVLQRASVADLALLVDLHQASFPGASLASMRERLNSMLAESHRQAWIAKNLEGKPIGKLHVREDAKAVFLHDFGIIPAFHQQGYGRSLLYHWYQQYDFSNNKPIMVDVLGDNQAALALYASCGFAITNQYNFWQFNMESTGTIR